VPTSGTATYSGIAYAWHAGNAAVDPTVYNGTVSVTVNFATRQTVVTLQNVGPAVIAAAAQTGIAGSDFTNYLTGSVTAGGLTGGLSGRFFGPVATGAGGTGPAEIGGAFSLSAGSAQTLIGGFIALKR
jgi:hypothetical protein